MNVCCFYLLCGTLYFHHFSPFSYWCMLVCRADIAMKNFSCSVAGLSCLCTNKSVLAFFQLTLGYTPCTESVVGTNVPVLLAFYNVCCMLWQLHTKLTVCCKRWHKVLLTRCHTSVERLKLHYVKSGKTSSENRVAITSIWLRSIVILESGRCSGLMVSALVHGLNGPGSSPGRGHCVVFLGKTLYSHSASLHPGV